VLPDSGYMYLAQDKGPTAQVEICILWAHRWKDNAARPLETVEGPKRQDNLACGSIVMRLKWSMQSR
jgi:hypothetical protein